MDELRSLYESLVNGGYYSKSFEEFQKQFKDPSYQDKVYGVVTRDNLFSKSKDEFLKQYAVGPAKPINEPLKKKDPEKYRRTDGESSSGVGSSALSGTDPNAPAPVDPLTTMYTSQFERSPIAAQDNTYVARQVDYAGRMEEWMREMQDLEVLREQSRQEQLAKAQEQEQVFKSQNLAANKDEDFKTYLGDVNANLISKKEEEVVPELNRRFGSYGFHFEEAKPGRDAMYVRTADGKHEIEIDLQAPLVGIDDRFTAAKEVQESKKLRDFLQLYAQQPEREKSEDYIGKSLRAKSMRDVGRLNDDGTYSTVKFTSYEEDGRYYVIPTLFPKDPDSYTTDKKDWMELPFEEALNEARKRGEIFDFETDEEAKDFAEGDWKDVNAYDIEGQKFYKDRGLDYYAEQKKFKNYNKLQDELELIERIMNREFITPQEKLDNPKYFSKDGTLLYFGEELKQEKNEVMRQKDNLLEQVYDIEFLGIGDGPVQKAREDFDVVLEERRNEIVGEAIKVNSAAKQEYDVLNETALKYYNVPIEKISTIVPKTPGDAKNIENLTRQLVKVRAAQQTAATNFEIAKTYYDAKWNKAANTEYEENWAGFSTAVSDAWKNGKAAEQILLLTLGMKDVENIEDRQEVARLIVEYLSSVSGSQSRALTRLNLSRDGEFTKALLADPLETILTFAASSFAQMAPYGIKIVPSATATGAATGAGLGLAGGPFAEITVPAGAITGGVYGLRTGMAATMLAMEYTNSILDVMREKDYNLMDPKQVEAALMDETVWSEGSERGIKRGIPIAIVDYLSSGLAGRVFNTSRLASTPVRVTAMVGERAIFDPAAEAAGEYAAQKVAGQEVEWKEIAYEALGGLGNNTSMMALNLYKETRNKTNTALAYELTDINRVANESVSDERISRWANNMHQLGKIDADVNQRIQENVGLRREAREITSVGRASRMLGEGRKVESRVMELLAAKKELTKSSNLKNIYRERISAIDQEIATIAETKKTLPGGRDVRGDGVTTAVNLDAILGTTREGVSNFKIGGKTLTREQFLKELENMNDRRLLRARVNIENDKEVESLYAKKVKDAIQKQSTGEASVQSETGVSPQVEERTSGTESEVTPQEGKVEITEEEDLVSSKTRLDEIRESLPERVKYKKNDLENFENLGEEKSRGVLASLAEKLAEGKRLTKAEQTVYDANKAQVDEFSDLVAERTAIQEEVADLEALLGRRAEFRAEESPIANVETTTNALNTINILSNVTEAEAQKNEGQTLIRADFGRNGRISYEISDAGSVDVLSIERNKGEQTSDKSGAIGEGSMAIASIFNSNKDVDVIYYDDESQGFWDAIGGKVDTLTREDFFKYYNNKAKSISESYHKAKTDGTNPELVKAVESLVSKPKAEFRAEEANKTTTFEDQKNNQQKNETERRTKEQEEINKRPNKPNNVLSRLLEKYSQRVRSKRGVNRRDIQGVKRLGEYDVNVIAEYTLDKRIEQGIIKMFPKFRGAQKIYEITDGRVYRDMMTEALKDNKFAASVTVHSAEDFDGMRMFVTEDGSTGITITKEGFLGSAFSNPSAGRPNNLSQLLVLGIKEGTTTVEAFDTVLPEYYSIFGFKAVSRTSFNDEFRPLIKDGRATKDWDYDTYNKFNNGRPDVVFFIYDGGDRNTIEDRLGIFNPYKEYEKDNTKSFDENGYDAAEEVMKQEAVKRIEYELEQSKRKKTTVESNLSKEGTGIEFRAEEKKPRIESDLAKEGTGVKLTGEENVTRGSNAPTVNTTQGYQDDYSESDIMDSEHSPTSRVVTLALNLASGIISYNHQGKLVSFVLPYINDTASKKIQSLKEKYKNVKGTNEASKAEKERIKREINKITKQVLREFTDAMTQNLLALYDTLTPEFIAESKMWYVGANRMANAIAEKYNMTIEQVGGIIAVLSPQNDWFNNVSVAERAINIMSQYGDTKITKDIIDKAVEYNTKSGKPNNFAQSLIDIFNKYGEVSINELQQKGQSILIQSSLLRAFDQGINSPKVAITDPTGKFVGFDKTPVRWNSEAEIAKAIEIFRDGNIKNVNEKLGNGNKVRNFYNNIVDPNSKTPYVTADTHALSAALNSPISANDASGFGLFKGSLEPAYALVKSAYINAAKIAGISPREMQSIIWEAQRVGINNKGRTAEKKNELFNYIREERTNNKTPYERATELIARNRSQAPEWGKSRGVETQKTSDEIRTGASIRSEQRVSDVSNIRGLAGRRKGDTVTGLGGRTTGRQGSNKTIKGLTQQEFAELFAQGDISNATKLANFLNITFPGVTISTDKVSFDNVMAQVGTEMYMKGDQVIYGVTVDGDIYINPDVHNSESALFNTTIHEFGHVWTDYLQTSEKGKKIYNRGAQLIEQGIANDENVKQIFEAQMKKYPGDRARAINETMAILIGNKGESITNKAVKSNFKEWLLDVWKFIKQSFKMSQDLTEEEIQNLTLDQFIGTALADIFSGKEIKLTEVQKKQLKNPEAMFSNTQSMQSIIQVGRANRISDVAIKQVLLNRGFKASDINNALVVQIDINTDLPREFANVEGGAQKGYQLFTEVRAALQRFAHMGPRGGIRREQTKTWGEIREKAIELLKANPIFQAQSDTVQMELISAFDRTIGTQANTNVTRQISAIRNNLRQRKIGAKELQQAKIAVKNLIRSVLPKSDMYSQAQINKLISIISNATESSILADTEKVMKIVEQQRAKMKKSVIKQMIELVNKKAKTAMTTTGKRRSGGLAPEGQAFFAEVKPILKAVIKNDIDFMLDLANELAIADADGSINEAILKENRGEKLTIQEEALLNKAFAFDTFGDLMNMELEEVKLLFEGLKDVRAESIKRLKTRREVRAMRMAAMREQANAQIAELHPDLFVDELIETGLTEDEVRELRVGNEVLLEDRTADPSKPKKRVTVDFINPNGQYISFTDGQSSFRIYLDGTPNIFKAYKEKIISRPKSRNELVQDRAAIRRAFQQGKIWSGFKQLVARWDYTNITGIKDFVRKRLLHLGSLMNLFDNTTKGLTFFTDNVYRPLNRMDEKAKVGYFLEMANLDAMANSIPGITKGYKQIRNMLQTGIHEFTINGTTQVYNADKLLRIYALSLNDVQREKLEQMGWDATQIDKIKDIVGPEPIEFANKLVDYFSNDYYESVNNVYSHVNDVNLGYISNYFPTITESQKVSAKLLEDGDFNGIFNAETAPALKERTDVAGLIELNYDFSDVVESHFVTMEKYKAYAEGVKDLNAIFQSPAFNVLLEESGLKTVIKRSVNFAITPNAGQKEEQTMLGRLMTKFTGFALAFKAVQIIKQATSFGNAFEDYSYFPPGSKVPRLIKGPVDLMMFMVDSAVVIATMPKQIRKAYNMSASVRDRLLKGIEGDVYGLESGSNVFSSIDKRTDIWARTVRAYKTGAAGPTVLGDILGVMGYMVNYNRNIANGMTQAEALEAFNNYNATQQTRRGTEKIPLQQNNTELSRAFTMFGSTVFLMINKVLNAQTNIFRALKEGKTPSAKDIRALVLNLGVSNALFVGAANLAKFIKGDDDDREEALRQMGRALLGLNLIENIPLIGAAVETALAYIEGDKTKRYTDNVVNPYMQVFTKMKKGIEEEDTWRSVQPIIEIVIGAQLDPFIGLYNGVQDGFDENAVYDMLGISKSYRPTQEEAKTPAEKPMSKQDMKRYFPDMYNDLYGPGGSLYDYEETRREQERLEREELQREKDLMYGYEESTGSTVWGGDKNKGGTVWSEKE